MQLRPDLLNAINALVHGKSMSALHSDFVALSGKYTNSNAAQRHHSAPFVGSDREAAAYVATRMPSIYSVLRAICAEIAERAPDFTPQSLLDFGSGPGTVLWAASEIWSSLVAATLVDNNSHFQRCGQALASESESEVLKRAEWLNVDLESGETELPSSDLVVGSYSLSELSAEAQVKTVARMWEATRSFLIIVAPGTPSGFADIIRARSQLVELGAKIFAPCACNAACPTRDPSWCHFPQRVERAAFQRIGKGASMSYEDEKYSYVVASHAHLSWAPINGRVVAPTKLQKHQVLAPICDSEGRLEIRNVAKRDATRFKLYRKLSWGDLLPD